MIQDIKDFHDVVRLLEEHPEWRAELRRLVLTDDLLALPAQVSRLTEQVAALVEAQTRTDARVTVLAEAQVRTEARLAELAEAQRRTDAQVATLTEQMVILTQAVQVLTQDVGTLKADGEILKADVATLKADVHTLKDDMGALKGKSLETHYRMHSSPFFGVLLRRPYVLASHEVAELLDDAVDRGVLSVDESVEIRRADLVVRGTRRGDGTVVYLVVEVSWTVDIDDVEQATQRAALLVKTGLPVLPVVAGEEVGPAAARLAQARRVWQVTNDGVVPPAP